MYFRGRRDEFSHATNEERLLVPQWMEYEEYSSTEVYTSKTTSTKYNGMLRWMREALLVFT